MSPVYIQGVEQVVIHAPKHQDTGVDEISVAALSGLLADDQHVLDAEVTAVAIPLAQKAAASGVASLDASSLVVQDPVNAVATATANKIVKRDASARAAFAAPSAAGDALIKGTRVTIDELPDRQYYSEVNILPNGSFEVGDPLTGWTFSGANATLSRSNTQAKIGTYSALLTRVGTDCALYQQIVDFSRYKGRKVTLGCWVYATVANRARLLVVDGVVATYSSYHSGAAGWEWITVTHPTNASAANLYVYLRVDNDDTNSYFDGAILVEGDSCPAFAPEPDGFLISHHTAAYTISAYETGQVLHTNLGAGAAVTISLPQTVTAGFTCRFVVMAAQELRIDPGAAGAIYINGAKQTDDKYITADDEAESIILTADGNGDWIASSVVGTWGVEG